MMPAMHAREIDVTSILAALCPASPRRPQLVTMFTDAGHCPHSKVGSYAVWAKTTGHTVRHAGVLKAEARNSAVAELRAIANGLKIVLLQLDPPEGSRIIAQTDNKTAIDSIKGVGYCKPHNRHVVATEVQAITDLVKSYGVQLELRYVEAHVGTGTPRHYVHDWCDRQCKVHLKTARQRVTS